MTVQLVEFTPDRRAVGAKAGSVASDYASVFVLVCLGSLVALAQLVKPLREV